MLMCQNIRSVFLILTVFITFIENSGAQAIFADEKVVESRQNWLKHPFADTDPSITAIHYPE